MGLFSYFNTILTNMDNANIKLFVIGNFHFSVEVSEVGDIFCFWNFSRFRFLFNERIVETFNWTKKYLFILVNLPFNLELELLCVLPDEQLLRFRYLNYFIYVQFEAVKNWKSIKSFPESVMLVCYTEISTKYISSTLSSHYSISTFIK